MSQPTRWRAGGRAGALVLGGLLLALVLAGFVSYYASGSPDGLNKVAIDHGFSRAENAHGLKDSPLAGYATRGVDNPRLSGGAAGVAGVVVTFLLAGGVTLAVRRRRAVAARSPASARPPEPR